MSALLLRRDERPIVGAPCRLSRFLHAESHTGGSGMIPVGNSEVLWEERARAGPPYPDHVNRAAVECCTSCQFVATNDNGYHYHLEGHRDVI